MGTDQLGRDVFIRVCYGAKSSLTVAFIAVVISLSIGTTIGAFSGFFAGKTDRILSIVFDALYAFPGIILAILIAVILGPGIFTTSVAISVGEIPQYFRVVRGLSLSLRERPYMEAEIALGARPRNLIFQHILPYAVPSIVTIMTLSMGSAILQVSGLGFLGLGLPPPTPEWGLDLGRGRDFITMGVWWASTFPGLMILVSVIGFTLIGEALSEILGTKKSVKMA
jgi:peptide/nickel transport system permease protein